MSTETKANVPVTGWTKGPVTVGDNPRRTRIHLFDAHGAPLAVVESASANTSRAKSDAALIAEAFNVATETGLTPRQLAERVETIKREAQIHAMEARTANATIAEIYQLCAGGIGEPGNWNGAEPVRQLAEQRAQLIEALKMTQFGFNHRRCQVCAGWNVGPNGETDDVHTASCPVGAILAKCQPAEDSAALTKGART